MGKTRNTQELQVSERSRIVALRDAKWTIKRIAADVGCSMSTVNYTLARFKTTGSNNSKPGRGRKSVLTKSDERYIAQSATRNRRATLSELTNFFNVSRKQKICETTLRKSLRKQGMRGRVACRKPLLSPVNIKKRLLFAKTYRHWTPEDWENVLFTDETKMELFGTNRRLFVRRRVHERYKTNCLIPTMKHGGGSIMIWGAVSSKGVGPLRLVTGTMDAKWYIFSCVNMCFSIANLNFV